MKKQWWCVSCLAQIALDIHGRCSTCGSAHNNEQKLMTLSLDEFLRRFLVHLLRKGFVRIRNFGFLANQRRATLLPLGYHGRQRDR